MTLELPAWYYNVAESALGFPLDSRQARISIGEKINRLRSMFFDDNAAFARTRKPYLDDDAFLRAYFVYFTSANVLKLYRPLQEWAVNTEPSFPLRICDVGCGPGTGLLGITGWKHARGVSVPVHYTGIDRSGSAVRFSRKIHDALSRTVPPSLREEILSCEFIHGDLDGMPNRLQDTFDLVLVMNTLNELSREKQRAFFDCLPTLLSPRGFLLLVEPAHRIASRRLLEARNHLVESGWTVYSPCFRQEYCPALEQERDWCHTEDAWTRPAFLRLLDRHTGSVKLTLKYSYMLLNRHGETLASRLGLANLERVVSTPFHEKGRLRLFTCGSKGRHLMELNRRDISPSNKPYKKLRRYDIAVVEGTADKISFRKVLKDSRVERVEPTPVNADGKA